MTADVGVEILKMFGVFVVLVWHVYYTQTKLIPALDNRNREDAARDREEAANERAQFRDDATKARKEFIDALQRIEEKSEERWAQEDRKFYRLLEVVRQIAEGIGSKNFKIPNVSDGDSDIIKKEDLHKRASG